MTETLKLTLSMVASLDGRTTSPKGPALSSQADRKAFENLRDSKQAVIMGRKTAEAHTMRQKNLSGPVRIVMTRNPDKYTQFVRPGLLEFTDDAPQTLIARLTRRGIHDILLAGGSMINSLFIDARLITEALITYEPIILGRGNGIFARPVRNAYFHLKDTTPIGDSAVQLRYTIFYDHHDS